MFAYLEAVDRGEAPSQAEWLARHPEFAGELAEFFADSAQVDRLAAPLRLRGIGSSAGANDVTATAGPEQRSARASRRSVPPRIFGDYELLEVLGQGGMGVVYRARQRSLNRFVALKMIRMGLLASPSAIERFRNEAEMTATLDHPHILPIYEVGEHDAQPYFTIKLVEGGSLASQLARYRDHPREAAQLVQILAGAVHHAHQHGVLHRDLKPSNIVLDCQDRPYITDFGLARHVQRASDLTRTGDLLGTPAYMAPEQITGRTADLTTAADVYGLGAILYSLLTGRPPFQEATVLETLKRVVSSDPEPPRATNRRVDRDLQTICLKCLEKHPPHRYASAAELAEDLGCWLGGSSIRARSISRPGKVWRWCKRYPAVTGLSLTAWLLLIAMVVSLATSNVRISRAQRETEAQRQKAVREGQEARRQRDAAAYQRYLVEMRLAATDYEWGQTGRLEEALHVQVPEPGQPDFRHWAWYYLLAQCHTERRTLRGHTRPVHAVAWSPDGQRLASAGSDRTIRIWNVESPEPEGKGRGSRVESREPEGKSRGSRVESRLGIANQEPRVLQGHFLPIGSVAWSPDGKQLASGGNDSVIRIWDTQTGKQVDVLPGHPRDNVRWVLWSPDGRRLVSTGEQKGTLKIWDIVDRKELYASSGWLSGFRPGGWSPDSQKFAWVSLDGTVRCCEAETGKETAVYRIQPAGSGILLSWGLDGRLRAAVRHSPDTRIVDPTSGQTLATLAGCGARGSLLDWSPDGKWLAAESGGQVVTVWDVSAARPLLTLRGHLRGIEEITWSPDGLSLATTSGDGMVKLWDVNQGPELPLIAAHGQTVRTVAWGRDSRHLASAGDDGTVAIWDTANGKRIRTIHEGAEPLQGMSWSPDGKHIAFATARMVRVRAVDRDEEGMTKEASSARAVAWSPDSRFVAATSTEDAPRIDLWEIPSGRPIAHLPARHAHLYALAWSPDGRWLASGGNQDPMLIWDTASWKEAVPPEGYHGSVVTSLAFSADGRRLASAGPDCAVKIWDVACWEELHTLRRHTASVESVAWSPDVRRLASGSVDESVRIWDVTACREIIVLREHPGYHFSVAWSPDGRKLASGSSDGTIKIWDASRGYQLAKNPWSRRDHIFAEGIQMVETGQYARAIAIFEELARQVPDAPQYRVALAEVHTERAIETCKRQADGADYAEVLADLDAALRLDPEHSRARLQRAMVYCLRGQIEPALADAAQAAALPDLDPRVASGLAWHLATHPDTETRSLKDALFWARKAVELAPHSGTIRNTLGVVEYRAGQWQAALATLEKSMELQEGGDSYDWFFVAMAHWQLGHEDEARQWYAKAVKWMDERRPRNEELRRFRAEAAELLRVQNVSPGG
ncbi:MAG: protein kinase [Pirellulales bacterium]|nr:protein kinase [Pirellulales bacterium]